MSTKKVTKTRKTVRATKSKKIVDADNNDQNEKIEIKEQVAADAVVKYDRKRLNFRRNKTTGMYSVYSSNWKRIRAKLKKAFLPFGVETFGDSDIVNVYFKVLDNFHHNFMVWLKEIDACIRDLPNHNTPFDLTGFEYSPIVKENHYEDGEGNEDMRYFFRAHLTPGVKIRHKSYYGNYDKNALRGKQCNVEFDIGSLWIDNEGEKYGCTIYITSILVLN